MTYSNHPDAVPAPTVDRPAAARWNTLAILAFVTAFTSPFAAVFVGTVSGFTFGAVVGLIFPPASVVLGHIALRQVRLSGERGYRLALAGNIVGYTVAVLALLIFGSLAFLMFAWGAVFG